MTHLTQSRRGSHNTAAFAHALFEPLETRQMLSAAAPQLDPQGALNIYGTRHGDVFTLAYDRHVSGQLDVAVNRQRWHFNAGDIQKINIYGGGGNDVVRTDRALSSVHPAISIFNDAGHRRSRSGGTTTPTTTTTTTGSFFPGKTNLFPIGVWRQPTYSFDKWKQMGINTLIGYESQSKTVSMSQWENAAVSRGLYMIREPSANMASDKYDQNLLAWMLPDEPEQNGNTYAQTSSWAKAWKQADPNRPIFQNFTGGYALKWQGNWSASTYQKYLAFTDWVSSDIYPVTGWNRPSGLFAPGQTVALLSKLSGGKPQMAFIEVSQQKLPWVPNAPGVTTGQFRAELWDAIIQGARGVCYFTQSFTPGFKYDNTTAELDAEMTAQNATLNGLAAPLESAINPAGMNMQLPSGLEGTWRSCNGKKYFIVLNTTSQALSQRTIKFQGIGTATSATVYGEQRSVTVQNQQITDDFGAYAVHVYQFG